MVEIYRKKKIMLNWGNIEKFYLKRIMELNAKYGKILTIFS